MDLLFEIIMELFLEGSIEINSNERVSKWIRYPILVMLILLFYNYNKWYVNIRYIFHQRKYSYVNNSYYM